MPILEEEKINGKIAYLDISDELKKHIGKTTHDLVQSLKDKGISQEINGDNISAFIQKARGEIAKVEAEALVNEA